MLAVIDAAADGGDDDDDDDDADDVDDADILQLKDNQAVFCAIAECTWRQLFITKDVCS